ncbi:MAG: lipid-transfer protein [Halieaceae bacterium]|nr:lipid-transfer protein [Halieaceae bacterium]
MNDQLKRKTAIAGIGTTEYSFNSGRSEQRLAIEAINQALQEAGLTPDDVDGLVNSDYEATNQVDVVNAMGMQNIASFATIPHGGGSPCGAIAHAAMMVASGQCKCVVAYRSMNERSGHRYGSPEIPARYDWVYGLHAPYGLIVPAEWVAMHGRRRMIEFGETREQWAQVPLTCRANANNNPAALLHEKKLTLEDYLNAPILADPLCRYDYCLETDGAVALVITSAEKAESLASTPAYIHAAVQGMGHQIWYQSNYYGGSLTTGSENVAAAKQLWAKSGLTPRNIDVAQIYDHFTPAVLTSLEDYGFCEKGDAGGFVSDGNIGPDGELPINTAGGLQAEGYIHGWNLILEAVRQIRGTSSNQVRDVEFSLVTSCCGAPTSAAILSR